MHTNTHTLWFSLIKQTTRLLYTHQHRYMCSASVSIHYSLSFFSTIREEYGLVNAAFQIIQGGVIPMDITTVETASKQTLYMTLLGSWGMIADVDIESEKFRKIGETRFVIGMYMYILTRKLKPPTICILQ